MSITFADVANGRALHQVTQALKAYEVSLENHLKQDYAAIKAEFEAGVAHFKTEVARLRGLLPAAVVEHLDEGKSPNDAVSLAQAGEPTDAAKAAAAAAETKPAS